MKKTLKIVLIVVFIIGIVWAFYYMFKTTNKTSETYETAQVEFTDIAVKAVATGSVKPREVIEIKPNISGVISKIHVKEGQSVKKGDLIASIRVIPSVASLNAAQQQINTAKISLNNEEKNFKRTKTLYNQGVLPKADYDNALASYQLAQQSLKSAQSEYTIAKTGIAPGLESYATIQIRATITGMILSIPVEIGNTVQEINNFSVGTTIASIANVDEMIFEGNVDEADVGKLKEGMHIVVTIGALPDESFNGVLNFISPSGVENNGIVQFEIKADIDLKSNVFLRANYSANAEVILSQAKNTMTLKSAYIQYDEKGMPFVDVVDKTNGDEVTYVKKNIETGITDGINTQILSGITKSDKIKISNNDLADDKEETSEK